MRRSDNGRTIGLCCTLNVFWLECQHRRTRLRRIRELKCTISLRCRELLNGCGERICTQSSIYSVHAVVSLHTLRVTLFQPLSPKNSRASHPTSMLALG